MSSISLSLTFSFIFILVVISFSSGCFPFIFLLFSIFEYFSSSFSFILPFSFSSFLNILSRYFRNIIYSTNFLVVPLMYFGSFPILIIVFCWIFTFVILFSNFSNLLSIIFIAFNIFSNRVSILLNSSLYVFSFSIRVLACSLRPCLVSRTEGD